MKSIMGSLIIIPVLECTLNSKQQLCLTKKFIDGVIEYCKYWNGDVKALLRVTKKPSTNMDEVVIETLDLPFEIRIIDFNIREEDIEDASIVLAGMSYKNVSISSLCQSLKVPCVYITEYSLNTQIQIIETSRVNFLLKIRRITWAILQNYKQKKSIKIASGVQCNGTPTYNKYKIINNNALLYFDNRVKPEQVISHDSLEHRLEYLEKNKPIRLAFSGRLIEMKGADHLIKVARELKENNFQFNFSIFGSGVLESDIKKNIIKYGLDDVVFMRGVLDFESELLPTIQNNVDLFVCCHRQGDPSCTYIETLACGVPIVGYSNEAFDGILQLTDIGHSVKMNDYSALSNIIIFLSKNRDKLVNYSYNAVSFANNNLFDSNFKKRINHLKVLCRQ
ncbi:glycosyltransferase [Methylobacter marinus]|uniref:glycosyltransferase n=1 Tax=Methylobacter marinus TaxID=34058 RepID=UPI00036E346E|nr:glycosyltransferase [Methylobacter marinus]